MPSLSSSNLNFFRGGPVCFCFVRLTLHLQAVYFTSQTTWDELYMVISFPYSQLRFLRQHAHPDAAEICDSPRMPEPVQTALLAALSSTHERHTEQTTETTVQI